MSVELLAVEPTIQDITNGLQRVLATIAGLRAYAIEPDKPNFPCAYPRLVDWSYDQQYGGGSTLWHFDIWILVGIESQFGRAQNEINAYLAPSGTNSIKAAIDADPRLQNTVSYATATGGGAYGRVDIAGLAALGASLRVEVRT
ncbi:MAG TPA: hypothetical protein VFB50_23755 [Chloroflexota bacterium]|nr:hypothetical protein [Chloroflexota bacterium]